MPVPLDEYPVHQVPLSMQHMATSDRNAYDRCYLNAHDRTGRDVPRRRAWACTRTSGVIDAYATVRRGDVQYTVRTSDALGDDRTDQQVGPYRIEVLEPLHRLRVVCEGARARRGLRPHLDRFVPRRGGTRPRHAPGRARDPRRPAIRPGGHVVGDCRIDGEDIAVSDDRWLGPGTGPGASDPWGRPSPRARRRGAGRGLRLLVGLRPAALRRLRHRSSSPRRTVTGPASSNEAVPRLAGGHGPPARAAGLARGRDPLPARDPPPRERRCST